MMEHMETLRNTAQRVSNCIIFYNFEIPKIELSF